MPAKQLYLDNIGHKKIDTDKDQLGSGRAGVVYRCGELALKAWFDVDPDNITKIQYLRPRYDQLPEVIHDPMGFFRRSPQEPPLGIYMTLLPDSLYELGTLFNVRQRTSLGLNLSDTLDVFLSFHQVISAAHAQDLLWEDFNRSNGFYHPVTHEVHAIDVDNWWLEGKQFGHSVIFTPEFADPELLQAVDKHQPFVPKKYHDWTSFALMLFNAILSVHPYAGIHSQYPNQEDLALRRLWVYHPQIGYPSNGAPKELLLGTQLYPELEERLARGSTKSFPSKSIIEYKNSLVTCQCGREHPRSLNYCPYCQAKPVAAPVTDQIQVFNLLQSPAPLVFVAWQGGSLHAITFDQRDYHYYHVSTTGQVQDQPLFSRFSLPAKFALVGKSHLAVHYQGQEIQIYDLLSRTWTASTTSQQYAGNRQLAFRGTVDGLLRLAQGKLLRGTPFHDTLVEEELPVDPLENQTWFWADPNRPIQLVLEKVGLRQLYMTIYKGQRSELDVPQLDTGEGIIATAVAFAEDSCLLLRLTKKGLRQFRRWSILSYDGHVLDSDTTDISGQTLPAIHSFAYSDTGGSHFLWSPTDAGLLREDLDNQRVETMLHSRSHVSAADHVTFLGFRGQKYHFLVYDQQHIRYLVV